jgi:hypothetical protein
MLKVQLCYHLSAIERRPGCHSASASGLQAQGPLNLCLISMRTYPNTVLGKFH